MVLPVNPQPSIHGVLVALAPTATERRSRFPRKGLQLETAQQDCLDLLSASRLLVEILGHADAVLELAVQLPGTGGLMTSLINAGPELIAERSVFTSHRAGHAGTVGHALPSPVPLHETRQWHLLTLT